MLTILNQTTCNHPSMQKNETIQTQGKHMKKDALWGS